MIVECLAHKHDTMTLVFSLDWIKLSKLKNWLGSLCCLLEQDTYRSVIKKM